MLHLVPGRARVCLRRRVGQVHAGGHGRAEVRCARIVRRLARLATQFRQRGVLQDGRVRVVLAGVLRNRSGGLKMNEKKKRIPILIKVIDSQLGSKQRRSQQVPPACVTRKGQNHPLPPPRVTSPKRANNNNNVLNWGFSRSKYSGGSK